MIDRAVPRPRAPVRLAAAHEAESLSRLALRSKAYWGYSAAFMDACRDELLVQASRIRDGWVHVAEDADGVAGYCALEPASATALEVEHLFVEPTAIGRGVGRLLMAHVVTWARQRGYAIVTIQADPHAAGFYRAIGAVQVGERASESVAGRQLPLLELRL